MYLNCETERTKEFRTISISSNREKLDAQIKFLLDEKYIPIIKKISDDYLIMINCTELEYDALRNYMPFNETMPIRNIIETKEKTIVYTANVEGVNK